jgi:hypothetical protein
MRAKASQRLVYLVGSGSPNTPLRQKAVAEVSLFQHTVWTCMPMCIYGMYDETWAQIDCVSCNLLLRRALEKLSIFMTYPQNLENGYSIPTPVWLQQIWNNSTPLAFTLPAQLECEASTSAASVEIPECSRNTLSSSRYRVFACLSTCSS